MAIRPRRTEGYVSPELANVPDQFALRGLNPSIDPQSLGFEETKGQSIGSEGILGRFLVPDTDFHTDR